MIELTMNLNQSIMEQLTEEQKIVFLKALLVSTALDGNVHPNEQKQIKKAAQECQVKNVKKIFEHATEADLMEEIDCLQSRKVALELAKALFYMGHIDHRLQDEEVAFICKICVTLGLEIDKVEKIGRWIVDYLLWQEQGKIIFEEYEANENE